MSLELTFRKERHQGQRPLVNLLSFMSCPPQCRHQWPELWVPFSTASFHSPVHFFLVLLCGLWPIASLWTWVTKKRFFHISIWFKEKKKKTYNKEDFHLRRRGTEKLILKTEELVEEWNEFWNNFLHLFQCVTVLNSCLPIMTSGFWTQQLPEQEKKCHFFFSL